MRTITAAIITCTFIALVANACATVLAETIADITTILAHATL